MGGIRKTQARSKGFRSAFTACPFRFGNATGFTSGRVGPYADSDAHHGGGIQLLGQCEQSASVHEGLKIGSGAQTSSAQRWGDYSTMQIDPDDDCPFWYTTEYTNNTSSANWATQIVSFKFNTCQ